MTVCLMGEVLWRKTGRADGMLVSGSCCLLQEAPRGLRERWGGRWRGNQSVSRRSGIRTLWAEEEQMQRPPERSMLGKATAVTSSDQKVRSVRTGAD